MFTDPPRLVERIARKIDDTRLVDPFSQIALDTPSARSLAELLSLPALQAELQSVGMPADAASPDKDPLDRAKACLPYLPAIRNTATAWRLFRILNDLYDFTEPVIDSSNVQALADKVAAAGVKPGWAAEVLGDRAHVKTFATRLSGRSSGLNAADAEDALGGVATRYYLDASPLLAHKYAAQNAERHVTRPSYLKALGASLGTVPTSLAQINSLVGQWLDATVTGQVRYTSVRLPMRFKFTAPDEAAVNHLLERAAGDVAPTDDETEAIVHAVAWALLAWHHEQCKTVQILATGHSPLQPTTCPAMMGKLFGTFNRARFAILSGTGPLALHITRLAAQLPNVYQVGVGSGNLVTDLIAQETALRLQLAPAAKSAMFLSHAPSVEWAYGNLQVARRGLAKALAAVIEDDYIHERQVPALLEQILHHSPLAIYGLN